MATRSLSRMIDLTQQFEIPPVRTITDHLANEMEGNLWEA